MLNDLQRALETIYGVDGPHRVEDFVIDGAALRQLGASVRAPEELLVVEQGGELELALYIDPAILRRLPDLGLVGGASGFLDRLLPAFSTAAEGVSHFLYLTLQALRERTVSLLELEVQAELDKFATALLYLWKQGERRRSAELRSRLFHWVGYRDGLHGDEAERYRRANQLVRDYAASLDRRFVADGRLEGLLRELRRAYRIGSTTKFEFLQVTGR